MRQSVSLNTFFNSSANEAFVNRLYVDSRGRVCLYFPNFFLGNADIDFYISNIQDVAYRLTGQCGLSGIHIFFSNDTADRCLDTTVGQILLRQLQLGLRLFQFCLYLYPFYLCQAVVVMQLFHSVICVVGLFQLCLGIRQEVLGLCFVQFGNQLSSAYMLAFVYANACYRATPCKTDGCTGGLFNCTYILLLTTSGMALRSLCHYCQRLNLMFFFAFAVCENYTSCYCQKN